MKRYHFFVISLLAIFAIDQPAAHAQQDAFDLSTAQIVNAPDVRSWPVTAAITRVAFDGATTRVAFTKQDGPDRWPDVTPAGWQGPLQYTLWLCLKTPAWSCSAFVQFWHGRDGSGSAADPDVPSKYDQHWYYAPRWAPLYGHGPIMPGELIGFFVTSGNARDSAGPYGPQERSNVVTFAATDRGEFTFEGPASARPSAFSPQPSTPTAPPMASCDLAPVLAKLEELKAQADANTEKIQQQIDQVAKNAERSAAPLILRILSLGAVK